MPAAETAPNRPTARDPIPLDGPISTLGRDGGGDLTPAGLQSRALLARRRWSVLAVNGVTLALLLWGVASVFAEGGWSVADVVILACFLVGAPWTVMGLWNAVLGLWLLHGVRDPWARVAPHLAAGDTAAPLAQRFAVTMTVRNEPPARSYARLVAVRQALDATGQGQHFDLFILSDTSDPEVAREEEALFARIRPLLGARAQYRRRPKNVGFKAGNVRDFLMKEGRGYDFYLPLDSDSVMDGATIVRMARIMEAYPGIGILQSLAVGTPARSAFARIFQFGMRHGMRSFTMGASWWQGDCGPYWGHNAMIRVDAFRRHCRLPILPGKPPLGGHVMSHDQIEAALMRRAGYEVRVMPCESGSYEDNPPTLMDFTRRDLRWCQGNMQYFPLLTMRGLLPASRFQLVAAVAMYFGAPAWMLMTLAAASKLAEGDLASVNLALGIAMFFIMFAVSLVPKLAGIADILLRKGGTAAYGGTGRFLASAVIETVFSILLAPVVAFRVTLFLIGLVFGRSVIWGAQNRDAYRLSWDDAVTGLWPQVLFGATLTGMVLGFGASGAIWWAAPMLLGLTLAIPFAVGTASPALGRWMDRAGLCAIPEEVPGSGARPAVLDALEGDPAAWLDHALAASDDPRRPPQAA